jgi:hypothetical protein
MKKTILIFSLLAFIASSCGQLKKQAKENTISDPEKSDTIFTSPIRPNEKLELGKIYTDHFEYMNYNDLYDYFYFVVKKNGETMTLIDACDEEKIPELNRGDIVEIQWKIDSVWIDGEPLKMNELATFVKNTKDGNVSLFKKKYAKPLKYTYHEKDKYTDWFFDEIYKNVEYYLANSTNDLVRSHVNSRNSNLGYSIEEQERDQKMYYLIGIYNETSTSEDVENRSSIIRWLYISEDLQTIYDYDLPNDELIKFE